MTSTKPTVKPDALLEASEAAQVLGIGRTTLHRYTQQGLVPFQIRKTNGRRVWKGSDLIALWNYVY